MTSQDNLEIFLGGFAKVFEEQWQVDVRLKAGDSDESAAISAHKLVLVFYFSSLLSSIYHQMTQTIIQMLMFSVSILLEMRPPQNICTVNRLHVQRCLRRCWNQTSSTVRLARSRQ